MIGNLGNLPFEFIMDLFRLKNAAKSRGDMNCLSNLMICYPGIFSEEFDEFIDDLKVTAEYLDKKYGENYMSMFDSESCFDGRTLN